MKTRINSCLLSLVFLTLLSSYSLAQVNELNFTDVADAFIAAYAQKGRVDYATLKSDNRLTELVNVIATADLEQLDETAKKAFHINAYNLLVIFKIAEAYPIGSVMDVVGFFDGQKVIVSDEELTLNSFEKELLERYQDPRLHFALVCGALGCPPITDEAYKAEELDAQLDRQSRAAINDDYFVSNTEGSLKISKIFQWYEKDFSQGGGTVISFLNKYAESEIPEKTKVKYNPYDWSLNAAENRAGNASASTASNASRYVVSSTIPKGTVELKIFNNLYSQQTKDGSSDLTNRSSFFTTSLSAFYGLSHRFNVGINTRYRKVRNNQLPSSPFTVFGSGGSGSHRSGLTAFGPQIRWAPVPQWSNFSIQSSFVFSLGMDLAGSSSQPYIDWNGSTWNTQFFNDFSIGNKFSLFTEVDFLVEDIGKDSDGHNNRISTPVTLIFSYSPTSKLIFYGLTGYSPYWQETYDYFYQYGAGTKYQFTSYFELELLYTDFNNKFLNDSGGKAETINLGLRLNF